MPLVQFSQLNWVSIFSFLFDLHNLSSPSYKKCSIFKCVYNPFKNALWGISHGIQQMCAVTSSNCLCYSVMVPVWPREIIYSLEYLVWLLWNWFLHSIPPTNLWFAVIPSLGTRGDQRNRTQPNPQDLVWISLVTG